MSMIFIVDAIRFQKEFYIRIGQQQNENIEWYIDNGTLHAYITVPGKSYYYSTRWNDVSPTVKMLLKIDGEVRGILKSKSTIKIDQNPNIEQLKLNFSENKDDIRS